MDDMNRFRFTSNEEWHPDTLTDGRLGPPGRKPPTALATATPQPPRWPYRHSRFGRLTALQRVARGMLSVLLVGSGALATALLAPIAGVAAGAALGGLGAAVAIRLIRQSRHRRPVGLESRLTHPHDGSSDSIARSA